MTSEIKVTAPTRVDIAGGTLDLWPVSQVLDDAVTVNVGIDLPASVNLRWPAEEFLITSKDQNLAFRGDWAALESDKVLPLVTNIAAEVWSAELPAFELTTHARSPAGAGLGGSSCLALCVARALYEARAKLRAESVPDEAQVVATVQDIEAKLIHAPTGCQDYWGASRGGINIIDFSPGRTQVDTIAPESFAQLDQSMIVCYSGQSRASALNNWEIFKRVFDRDRNLIECLNSLAGLARKTADALRAKDLDQIIDLSRQEWLVRTSMWPNIETERTRAVAAGCERAGAEFSRVCGAGGGGVMAIFCDPNKREDVSRAAEAAGGEILEAGIVAKGIQVIS